VPHPARGRSFFTRRACPCQSSLDRRATGRTHISLVRHPEGPQRGWKDAAINQHHLAGIWQSARQSINSMPRYVCYSSLPFHTSTHKARDTGLDAQPNQCRRPDWSSCRATTIDMSRHTTLSISTTPIVPVDLNTISRPVLQSLPNVSNTSTNLNGVSRTARPIPTTGLIIPDLPIQYADGTRSSKEDSWAYHC